jgi:hypothetical protein
LFFARFGVVFRILLWKHCFVAEVDVIRQRIIRGLAVLLLLVALQPIAGCIYVSTQVALYDPASERQFDRALIGTWTGELSDGRPVEIAFEPSDQASYLVTLKSVEQVCDDSFCLPVDLVKFHGRRYLFPTEVFDWSSTLDKPVQAQVSVEDHRIEISVTLAEVEGPSAPAQTKPPEYPLPHWKIKRRGDRLYVRGLDTFALGAMLLEKPHLLAHDYIPPGDKRNVLYRGNVALQSQREELRKFISKHDAELYHTVWKLKRKE